MRVLLKNRLEMSELSDLGAKIFNWKKVYFSQTLRSPFGKKKQY